MCGTPGAAGEHDRETLFEQGFHVQERQDGVQVGSPRLIRWVQEHEVESLLIGGPAFEERPDVRTPDRRSIRGGPCERGCPARRSPRPGWSPRTPRSSAPRDNASTPSAPVPAYRSSTRAPSRRAPRLEKSPSRTRSDTGRTTAGTRPSRVPLRAAGDDPHRREDRGRSRMTQPEPQELKSHAMESSNRSCSSSRSPG